MRNKLLLSKCFICNDKAIIYCENIYTLRSCHTDTLVMDFLQKFADELEMDTDWPKNRKCTKTIVCQMCMIKINEYDLACMNAKTMERQLKELLQKKKEFDDTKSDVDYNPDAASSDDEEDKSYDAMSNGMEVTVMRCNICEINFNRFAMFGVIKCEISFDQNFCFMFLFSYRELTSHTHQPKKIEGLIIKKIKKNGQSKIVDNFKDISSTAIPNTPSKSKRIKKRNFSCNQCESSFYKRQELRVRCFQS